MISPDIQQSLPIILEATGMRSNIPDLANFSRNVGGDFIRQESIKGSNQHMVMQGQEMMSILEAGESPIFYETVLKASSLNHIALKEK